jgi:tellurite resistance protein
MADLDPPRDRPAPRKIPANFFGIGFGVAGLGNAWLIAAHEHLVPRIVSSVLFGVAALAWLAVLGAYLLQLRHDRQAIRADLTNPIASPFVSLALLTPLILATQALHPVAPTAGRVVVDVLIGLTVLLGGWLTGQWIYGEVGADQVHPGFFLPTVAGGLIASVGASAVGQTRLAQVMFGLGMVCWLVLGSIILNRLITRPPLPPPLLPTIAIEVAPAAVASLAWFALAGPRLDLIAAALGGYGLLMALAQLRLVNAFVRLPFMPSTWAFTFSWAAVATVALIWLDDLQPAGWRVWQIVVLTAITLLITAIAARTVLALARRQLPPAPH